MKKIVSVFLILTYVNFYLGCASNRIQKIQYNDIADSMPEKKSNDFDLYVFTNDSSRIIFAVKEYQFMEKTLNGSGRYFDDIIVNSNDGKMEICEPKQMQIPYADIVLMTQGEQDLYLIKTDSTELFFKRGSYIFNNDSLFGTGLPIFHDKWGGRYSKGNPHKMQIALADISGIGRIVTEENKAPQPGTRIVIGLVAIGVIVLLVIVIGDAIEESVPKFEIKK